MRRIIITLLFADFCLGTAFAHPGHGAAAGLGHGFLHPLSGADHILAMVAVGLLAANQGGKALWLIPLSFMSMMAMGGALGMANAGIPYVEFGIGLSIVVIGAIALLRLKLPVAAAMAMVGFFAVFHGYAHGAEMPRTASGLEYGAGFVLATGMLHAIGIGLGLAFGRLTALRTQSLRA